MLAACVFIVPGRSFGKAPWKDQNISGSKVPFTKGLETRS